jgi:uncharacterized SAM-binding protein YcdF (DUF218 family)
MRLRRRGLAAAAAGAIVLLLLVVLVLLRGDGKREERLEWSREAIVVLGMQLHSDDMPRAGLKRRVLKGVELWKAGGGRALLLLSGARKSDAALGAHPVTEAGVMREIAICAGMPAWALWTEERASNTVENAHFVAALLETLRGFAKVERVQVVSSDWHLARASLAFEVLLAPQLAVSFSAAPDGGSEEATARDLVLLPATLRDLEAVVPQRWPVAYAAAARVLAGRGLTRIVLWAAPGAGLPPSGFGPCTVGDGGEREVTVALVGATAGDLTPCSLAPTVFVEAHPRQAARVKDAVVTRGPPVSSSTWLYRLECSGVVSSRSTLAGFSCYALDLKPL